MSDIKEKIYDLTNYIEKEYSSKLGNSIKYFQNIEVLSYDFFSVAVDPIYLDNVFKILEEKKCEYWYCFEGIVCFVGVYNIDADGEREEIIIKRNNKDFVIVKRSDFLGRKVEILRDLFSIDFSGSISDVFQNFNKKSNDFMFTWEILLDRLSPGAFLSLFDKNKGLKRVGAFIFSDSEKVKILFDLTLSPLQNEFIFYSFCKDFIFSKWFKITNVLLVVMNEYLFNDFFKGFYWELSFENYIVLRFYLHSSFDWVPKTIILYLKFDEGLLYNFLISFLVLRTLFNVKIGKMSGESIIKKELSDMYLKALGDWLKDNNWLDLEKFMIPPSYIDKVNISFVKDFLFKEPLCKLEKLFFDSDVLESLIN